MKLWAIETRNPRGRPWINAHTVRATRRDAWQAYLDLGGDDPERKWWDEVHRMTIAGEAVAVKVNLTKAES